MKLRKVDDTYYFRCKGCGTIHGFDGRWSFNGDLEKPTFSPSLQLNIKDTVCQLTLKGGVIHFTKNCTHELAGKKISLNE